MAKSLVTSDASTTPIVDLVALDLAKADLEREKAVVTDKLKEAALLRDRHAKVIEDQTSRLKHHGSGMLAEDKAEIQRAVLAATAGLNEAKREVARLTKDDRALAGGLSEVKLSNDAVYAALRREMLSAGSGVDPSGSALRDGIFSIVHELAELSTDATSFFVYNPRAEGVPHFTTWETKSSSLVRSITDKFTAAHRCILNALNKIASGSPDLAAHDYLWATLVNDAANAFLATVARVLDTSMGDLRRVLDGGCAQPLFSINVKLTANSKLILAPAMTESYKLVQPLLTAAFDMAQLPHFRTATTVQAKAPSTVDSASRPATAGRRVAAAKHTGPLSAAVASDCGMEQSLKYLPCLAGHVKGIQNACAVLDQRVADIVNTLDATYGHLWSSQLPDMTLSQLEVSRRAIEADAGFEKGTTVGDAIHVNTFPLHDAVLSMMAQQESKLRANSLARALEDVASAIEDSSIKTIRRSLPASLLPAGASAQGSGVPKKPQVLGAAPPKVPDLTIDPTKLDPDAAHERAKQAGADANFKRQEEQAVAAAAKDTTPRQSQQHLSSMSQSGTDVDVAPQVSPRPSTTPVGYRGSTTNAAPGQSGRSGSERSLRGGAARDDTLGAMSASKRLDGPATPNPKGERSSQRSTAAPAASSGGSSASGRLDFSSGPSSGHAAWGTPPRQAREQPPSDDGLRSPASQARTNATLHMSTPPQSPSAAPGSGFNSSASSPSAAGGRGGGTGGSHMDRLAAKERESMDRLKNLREQAEARRRALDDAPDAPTPQQMQQEQKQQQQQHGRPSAASSSGSRRPTESSTPQPTSGRRASKTTPSDAATNSAAPSPAHHHQHHQQQQDMTTDPDARRRERAAALQRERLQREREMLLESHRAQERRRDAEKAQAEADMAAKIKAEQLRRQKELEAERQADERRREAADRDRTRRDAQRKVDEQRESELRQRLDELERRRRSDARRFTDERTSSAQASPEKSAAAAATTRPSIYASPSQRQQQHAATTATSNNGNAPPSPYSVRPSSRGAKPAPAADNAIDPLSGTDTAGHAAPDSARGGSSSHGATTTTATSSALRKKLGLPPTSGTSTPTTANAPTSGRQFGQAGGGGVPYASQQRTTPPPSSAPAGAPHPAPTPTTASSPGPQKPPSTAEASTTRAGSHSLSGTRPSSSPGQTAGVAVDGIASIDTAGKSHLEVYRSYCTALNIKPNSGLLKSLPDVPGRHSTSINLDLNYIGVRGVRPLIEILKLNRGLTLLNLKDNNLENAEVRQIVSVLMGDAGRSIEHLDLSNNPISLAGGSAIMDLVSRQPTLRTVVLKGTLIQAKVVEKITEAASRNPGA